MSFRGWTVCLEGRCTLFLEAGAHAALHTDVALGVGVHASPLVRSALVHTCADHFLEQDASPWLRTPAGNRGGVRPPAEPRPLAPGVAVGAAEANGSPGLPHGLGQNQVHRLAALVTSASSSRG